MEFQFQKLVEHSKDLFALIDEDGNLLYYNRAVQALLGYPVQHYLGYPVIDLVHPDDTPAALEFITALYAEPDETRTTSVRIVHKDGSYCWLEVTGTNLLEDPDVNAVMLNGHDITAHKEAEETLRRKTEQDQVFQQNLKALHEVTLELALIDDLDEFYKHTILLGRERFAIERLALFLYDPQTNIATGTYGTSEDGKLSDERDIWFKPSPEDVLMAALQRKNWVFFKENTALYTRMKETGEGWNAAAVLWNGRGSLGWLVADNLLYNQPISQPLLDILSLYGLAVGALLARKTTAAALRESETRYRLLAENISDVVMQINAEGEILYISPSVHAVLGYNPDELLGRSGYECIHPDDITMLMTKAITALNSSDHSSSTIYRFRHKDGRYIWMEASGQVIRSETGGIGGFIVSNRNITGRKQAEEALRESEARYRLLAENISDVVVRLDANGNYIYVSPSSINVSGYSAEELLGKNRLSFIHPEDLAFAKAMHTSSLELGESIRTLTYRFLHKDGHYIWMEATGRAIRSETTGHITEFIYSARDVSERKHAEFELQRRGQWYHVLASNIPGTSVFLFDRDLRYLVAEGARPVYKQAQKEGRSARELLPEIGLEEWLPLYEAALGGEYRRIETRSGDKIYDIQFVPIREDSGEILTGLIVVRDITLERQAERTIRENEERLRVLFDNVPDALALLTLDGVYVDANPTALKMSGYTREDIIGKNNFDLPIFGEEDTEKARLGLELSRRGEQGVFEMQLQPAHGSSIMIEVLTHPITIQGERLHLIIARDITARKQAEESLRKTLETEKELGELKSRFVSIASHEFRTPLASIMSSSELLIAYRDRMDEDRVTEKLSAIVKQVKYLTGIINDVLDLSRLQSGRFDFKPAPVSLDEVCREIVNEFQNQLRITQGLFFTCEQSPFVLNADKNLMRQVINNLISNAIKYSPETSSIFIHLERGHDGANLSVRDQGIGIPEADVNRLFEPFHRAANVGRISGTGLGLSIVQQVVELHGGTISVESEVGTGSSFHITIPYNIPLYADD